MALKWGNTSILWSEPCQKLPFANLFRVQIRKKSNLNGKNQIYYLNPVSFYWCWVVSSFFSCFHCSRLNSVCWKLKCHKIGVECCDLRWNSWAAFLVEVSGHKLQSSQTRVYVGVFYPHFSVLQMLLRNRLEFSCFSEFFVNQSMVFFKIRQ